MPSDSPFYIFIIGSDGLWDNLHEKAMVDIVNQHLPFGATNPFFFSSSSSAIISRLSNAIGTKARELSLETEDYLSPFGMAGLAAGVFKKGNKARYLAGKPDDITVIVSVAVPLKRNSHPQQQQEEEVPSPSLPSRNVEPMLTVPEIIMDEVELEDNHSIEDHPFGIASSGEKQQQLHEEEELTTTDINRMTTTVPLFALDLQVRICYLYIISVSLYPSTS